MELTLLTQKGFVEDEATHLTSLFKAGLEVLHLKKSNWSTHEIEELIQDIPKEFHGKIIIHGHYNLALKYKLKGIHLRRKHRAPKLSNRFKWAWLKLRQPGLVICTTFHGIQSLKENQTRFDYAFLGSVFNSHSHFSQNEEAGINLLKSIIRNANIPIYALGGVNRERVPLVEAAGFTGYGVCRAIWQSDKSPTQAYTDLVVG
mgnify:CR=1 FL=1